MSKPLLVICTALAAFWAAAPAAATAAGAGAIHCKGVTVSSKVLRIGGVLSDPESFKGTLRVKATREGRKPYFLPSGDLVATASIERRIPAGRIEIGNPSEPIPFDPKKGKGRWRSIPVTVKDVRFAAEYSGRLELGSGGCKVDFFVAAAGGAEISLVGTGEAKAVKLKLARCRYFTCGPEDVAQSLNSSAARKDWVRVQIDNAAQGPADITEVQVALNSEVGGEIVSKRAFLPEEQEFQRPAQRVTTLPPIWIERGEIEPGHYTGAVYLKIAGAEKRVVLPFEIDLKDGPFWALVALLAALVVQLLVALANVVKPRGGVLREVKKLRKKAKQKLGGDAGLLQERLDLARDLAIDGKLDEAKAALKKIDADIGLIERGQALEEEARSEGGVLPAKVDEAAEEFHSAIEKGDGSANAKLTDLRHEVEVEDRQALVAEPPAAAMGGRSFWQWLKDVGRKAGRVGVWLSIYVLPWLLRGVLVVAFLFAGLEKLYFSNATFGAQDVVDYGGLFLWGLTAAAFNTVLGKIVPDAGKS